MSQIIGLDIGRGFTKGFTLVNNTSKSCLFKSVIGEGRNLDFNPEENPVYIEFEGENYFVGLIAEKESQTPIRNSKDSKTTNTVRVLIAAALSQIAVEDTVKIMLGVPYKSFRKSILEEVIKTYKGQVFKVKDKINGGTKHIEIEDISIYREGDSALYWELKEKENTRPAGIVNIGFRTTEITYLDQGLKFNDKKSDTIEFGNRSILNNVKDKLLEENIIKDLTEIDSSSEYGEYKDKAYKLAGENIEQIIEDKWVNLSEMDIYISGGTSLNLKLNPNFKVVEDAQMATAKGLWLIGTKKFI